MPGPEAPLFLQPSLYLTPGNGQNPSGGGKYAFLKIRLVFQKRFGQKATPFDPCLRGLAAPTVNNFLAVEPKVRRTWRFAEPEDSPNLVNAVHPP
jgi:hypothetical protein